MESIYTNRLDWAPDGDEAFDDGSYVLQFDVADQVRLIAFRVGEEGCHKPTTLRDVTMSADLFYGTLTTWHSEFKREWESLEKRASE